MTGMVPVGTDYFCTDFKHLRECSLFKHHMKIWLLKIHEVLYNISFRDPQNMVFKHYLRIRDDP